jgi:hypothetical protein
MPRPRTDARVARPTAATPVSAYDRAAALGPQRLEALLARGQQREMLRELFGAEAWRELSTLAVAAHASRQRQPRGRTRAWVLPGIMGTQLGFPRGGNDPPDAVWLDPADLIDGRALELRQRSRDRVRALGVIDQSYLKMRLRLAAAGYDPEYCGYDWRLGIARLGAGFATRLRADGRPAVIVAHSLGGLVARAALRRARLPPISRVVLLGTPNFGSYAAVQAMRGSYAVVRRVAMLDRRHDADTLTRTVFSTFASLYDLLPYDLAAPDIDYHDRANWPKHGPGPDPARLAAAANLGRLLLPGDERCAAIAGIGAQTVVAARPGRREFTYTYRRDGDGTVPVDSAQLPGAPLYVAPVAHALLPRDDLVGEAVLDLLRDGQTRRLAAGRPRAPAAVLAVRDRDLHLALAGKLDWPALSAEQRRRFLDNLNDAGPLRPALLARQPRETARGTPAGAATRPKTRSRSQSRRRHLT